MPNTYGRLRDMDLMPGQGVRTRSSVVEEKNGILNLLPTRPVGAPGTVADLDAAIADEEVRSRMLEEERRAAAVEA